jgi:hypothetical protein
MTNLLIQPTRDENLTMIDQSDLAERGFALAKDLLAMATTILTSAHISIHLSGQRAGNQTKEPRKTSNSDANLRFRSNDNTKRLLENYNQTNQISQIFMILANQI